MSQESQKKPKILVILGPTASGKSDLAVEIALRENGEVISADSRQVYKGLNIGTGKITQEEMHGVPHHIIDVAGPHERYSVASWKTESEKAIADILSRGKLPIICGGTGFYIENLIDDIDLPEVPPNSVLRVKLDGWNDTDLLNELKKLDPDRASKIDPENKRRIIRAIEIATALGKVPASSKKPRQWDVLKIGISIPDEKLRERIHTRLLSRIEKGMIEEVKNSSLSPERLDELGLEYRYVAEFLRSDQSEVSRTKFIENLSNKIWQYSRRQMTWFRHDKEIEWFAIGERENIRLRLDDFLGKNIK